MMQDSIDIFATSTRNRWSFTILGLSILLGAIISIIFFKVAFGIGIVGFIFGIILTVLGISKLIQPRVSIELRPQGLVYHHYRGTFYLQWENIQRVDIPTESQGLGCHQLAYIGIKLKHLSALIDDIPVRLAVGLLTEQRHLLMSSLLLDGELTGLENHLSAEYSPHIVDGKEYQGVQAMFSRRCEQLNAQLGYHIYLPQDSLDREAEQFLQLLKSYKAAILSVNDSTHFTN